VIPTSSFFFIFDKSQQLQLAYSFAGLLSPEPGYLIFDEKSARPMKGSKIEAPPNKNGTYKFCRFPETVWYSRREL